MTSQADAFSNRSAAKRSEVEQRSEGVSLRIAVLGPNLDDISNVGTQKRYQTEMCLRTTVTSHSSQNASLTRAMRLSYG